MLTFPGRDVDISEFVTAHAGDVTPTSRMPVIKPTRADLLLDRIWRASGELEVDGRQVVVGLGAIIPLEDVSAIDGGCILVGRLGRLTRPLFAVQALLADAIARVEEEKRVA